MRAAQVESPWIAAYAAALLPFALHALTVSGHGYWLDSGEFTAAAVWLDIAHPPGHPVASLWGKLFSLLPAGPLSFRVAIGQAVAGALALAALQRAFARSLAHVGVEACALRSVLSVGGCWLLGTSYGFWFQAVRAEVYALEALLVCVALERLSVLACSDGRPDPRPLYLACAFLGLGLANHHFIAVLAVPCLVPFLVRLTRVQGPRVLGYALGAGALGVTCYAYLPLRAVREPPMDLGHPLSLRSIAWVVSARVYARRIGGDAPQPLGERMLDLLVLLSENLGVCTLLAAALGAYALLRSRRTHALATLWLLSALLSLCGRAWLNAVRANPDVLGYMLPGFAALVALALLGLGALLASVPARLRRAAGAAATLALGALLIAHVAPQHTRATLARFEATDAVDALRRRNLPSRALLVLTTPDAVFRHWEGEALEALRGDVVMLPLPFVDYGAVHEVWLRRHPELGALVEAYRAHGTLSAEKLVQLAGQRPVYVELDLRTSLGLYAHVLPEGLLYRVLPTPPTRDDAARAGMHHGASLRALSERVTRDLADPETRKQLLLMHYIAALYAISHGDTQRARAATRAALELSPHARELRLLARMLHEPRLPAFDTVLVALGHAGTAAIVR